MPSYTSRLRTAILGASGYTGAELLRLLSYHPFVSVCAVTSEQSAGKSVGEVFPHLRDLEVPLLLKSEDVLWEDVEFVLCALPHGTTQKILAGLPSHIRIVDLSADFRLRDELLYERWYGQVHQALWLQREAVYGLTEVYRQQIKDVRLVANPGCYPTAVLLPLIPLLRSGCIESEDIIIDAKSGVSGAGRGIKPGLHFCEVNETVRAYGTSGHRHVPEIEQELSLSVGKTVYVSFTPHLIPITRGELVTIYVRCISGVTVGEVYGVLAETYYKEEFVRVLPCEEVPSTSEVQGTNECRIGVCSDRVMGRVRIIVTLDNLIKGASGQAIQNMNIMQGWSESVGLGYRSRFP